MRFSINISNYSWPGDPPATAAGLIDTVRRADELGLDTVWVGDHLIQANPYETSQDILEAHSALAFAAAHSRRVRLGTMVAAVTFRPPALLIKAVTTLDLLSGGRAWFGIGAGYNQEEATAMGLPLPPVAERFERLEETLRLARQMWSGSQDRFDGKHYRLERPVNAPNSLQRPHPPILIGGAGERKTLRLVARYADACNLFDVPGNPAVITHKLDVLRRHCEQLGRPYQQIEKTLSTRLEDDESPQAFATRADHLSGLGIDHLVVIRNGPWTPQALDRLASAATLLNEHDPT